MASTLGSAAVIRAGMSNSRATLSPATHVRSTRTYPLAASVAAVAPFTVRRGLLAHAGTRSDSAHGVVVDSVIRISTAPAHGYCVRIDTPRAPFAFESSTSASAYWWS